MCCSQQVTCGQVAGTHVPRDPLSVIFVLLSHLVLVGPHREGADGEGQVPWESVSWRMVKSLN